MLSLLLAPLLATQASAQAGVIPTGPNGPTNPDAPFFMAVGSQINQTSDARLITVNGIDDFCIYAPPDGGPDSTIGNREHDVVAWCTKPRNNARLIPDGVIKSAQLIKTDAYIQLFGIWDGTQLNIPAGDAGGELDPHGPTGAGNPVGGNVTTNLAAGTDTFYEEWMSFVSYNQFCIRICTANYNNIPSALMCEHELDIMGCHFVMAISNDAGQSDFTECEGEVAAPPGLYPQPDGSYSTFRQRFTGTWGGAVHTIGNTVTPGAPAFIPKTSNCKTFSTISNGIDTANYMVRAAPTLIGGGFAAGNGSTGATSRTTVVSVSTTSVSPTPVTLPSSAVASSNPTPAASSPTKTSSAGGAPSAGVDGNADGSKPGVSTDAGAAEPAASSGAGSGSSSASQSGSDSVRQMSIVGTFGAVAVAMAFLL